MIKRNFIIILLVSVLCLFCIAAVPMIDPETDDPIGRKEVIEWSQSFAKFLDDELPKKVDESLWWECSKRIETRKKDDGSVTLVMPESK